MITNHPSPEPVSTDTAPRAAGFRGGVRNLRPLLRETRKLLGFVPRAFRLVWDADPLLTGSSLVLTLISALFPAAVLWLTKLVIDAVGAAATAPRPGDLRALWTLVALLGGFWVLEGAATALINALTAILRVRVEQHTQILIMRKCARLDLAFFENPKTLDMLENASQGALMSAWTLIWTLLSFVRTALALATFLAILTRLHWLAAVLAALTTGPQMIAASYFARRHWEMMTNRAEDSRLRFYISWLVRQRESAKEIQVLGLTETMIERFCFFCRKFLLQEVALERRSELVNFLLGILASAGKAAIWVYVILRAVSRTINIGDVVLYTQAVSYCSGNLVALFAQGGQLYEQTLYLGSLFSLLDLDPGQVDGALQGPGGEAQRCGSVPAPMKSTVDIEFRNVSFRYPGSQSFVLRNLSFFLRPGQSVALVGKNGAGKTTLIKLLLRLYDPTEGEIFLEGRPMRDYDLASLRQCFSVIFQDFVHYELTARENIGFGQVENLNHLDQIRAAARQADAQGIIEKLPRQYETYLSRRFGLGEDLSGGEWQKISLARGFFRESPVLILDEPTASLDAFAEHEIYRSINTLASGRTSIIISHRFSTVRHAHHILVINEGSLLEEGTHEALMARGGLYAQMFTTQADKYRS